MYSSATSQGKVRHRVPHAEAEEVATVASAADAARQSDRHRWRARIADAAVRPSMDAAVDKVIEESTARSAPTATAPSSTAPEGEYGDAFLKMANKRPTEVVEYTKEICNYIWDTYGRFPAHVNAICRASGCSSLTWRWSSTTNTSTPTCIIGRRNTTRCGETTKGVEAEVGQEPCATTRPRRDAPALRGGVRRLAGVQPRFIRLAATARRRVTRSCSRVYQDVVDPVPVEPASLQALPDPKMPRKPGEPCCVHLAAESRSRVHDERRASLAPTR